VDVVNAAFTPTEEEVAHAKAIVEAFAKDPTAGVVRIDGKMIDKPHLRAAQKILGITN
jgi:citrate lyase subunit beta/citryl-CoA lyase